MYTLKISNSKLKEQILNYISEYDIFSFYISKTFKIAKKFKSPLREDNNPSFSIFVSNNEQKLLFKDFSTGESGDCFKFVQLLFNINKEEAIKKIWDDIINNKLVETTIGRNIEKHYKENKTNIEITVRNFNETDINYWLSYNITKNTLDKFKVFAVINVWINDEVKFIENINEPIYSYIIFDKYKIYRPFSKKFKWLSNATTYDIQGYEQLPDKGELLIITKSLKDVMTLYELGYTSIACSSENVLIPKIIFDQLSQRFKKILIFYDNDISGINGAIKLANYYNINYVYIEDKNYKDISDFVKSKGKNETLKLLKELCH